MAIAKIILNGVTQMDLTSDTVDASKTLYGETGHKNDGTSFTGNVGTGTEGTPTATKGTVSNHSISVTPSVTNSAGVIAGGTHTGTAVTVTASELVSGTYSVTSSGTKDVTNYASASIPAGTAGTPSASKGSVSNHSITVTPSVTNTTGFITGSTLTGTGVTVTASELASGNKEITENGTGIDVVGYSTVSVSVSGGGSSDVQIANKSVEVDSDTGVIAYTNLHAEPTSFFILYTSDISTGASPYKIATVMYDGTNTVGQIITNTSNAQVTYTTDFYYNYSNGTLEVAPTQNYLFAAGFYYMIYSYGGTAGNIGTQDVQVGSGATSITFTGLDDEPEYWSCIFKSNFSTSSGYQRVIAVGYDGADAMGMDMDSAAHAAQNWTWSYNNGSLTITSTGTNVGGYFHQPGYYQLTYAISGDQTLQTKTVTPTTSTQNVTADTGYTALKKVVVNPIPSSYVQPTTTVGATTYRASTSSQTISAGTYHSAAATIAAVSQTNLTADNIKSGTTISISNGQSNIWSVTGTYTGGGTSKNTQVVQGTTRTTSSTMTAIGASMTVSKAGTYDVYWSAFRSNTSSSYTYATQLYVGGSAYGSENSTWTNHVQNNHLSNVSLTANQTIRVYGRNSRGSSYYIYAPTLVIVEA